MSETPGRRPIAIATGTRADWGLLRPIAEELRRLGDEPLILATHAHLMPEMGHTVDEITADCFTPAAMIPAEGEPAEATAQAVEGFADALRRLKPRMLLILGDRFEMLGAASAALLCGVRIAHIAGGTVSAGAFDDAIRNAISMMAEIHFPETDRCAARLRAFGIPEERIITAGAPGLHGLQMLKKAASRKNASEDSADADQPWQRWIDRGDPFLVVTLHAETRPADKNYSHGGATEALLDLLEPLLPAYRLILTYPNADVDPEPAIRSLKAFAERHPEHVFLTPSLGHRRYLKCVVASRGVVGNSSSGLVEVPSLGVPTLDLGHRQDGRECGPSVVRCPQFPAPEAADLPALDALSYILTPKCQEMAKRTINPYYRPDTVEKIAATLHGIS